MAEKPIQIPKPLIEIPEDMKARLLSTREELIRAKADIERLKKVGLSTEELENTLNWAESATETLLVEFAGEKPKKG
jgi:hypothetical protein